MLSIPNSLVTTFNEWIPLLTLILRFLVAILIAIGGFILGRLSERLIIKSVQDLRLVTRRKKNKKNAGATLGSFVKFFIYIAATIIALNQIGIALKVLNNFLIVILVIVGIGLLLSIKDFVPNALAGIHILTRSKIKVGQYIKVQGVEGEIKSVDLIETKIKTKIGYILVPNSFFVKNTVSIKEAKPTKASRKK